MNTTLTARMVHALEYFGRQATGDLDVAGPIYYPRTGTIVALIRRGLLTAGMTHVVTTLGWVELESRGTVSKGYSGFTLFDVPVGATLRDGSRVSILGSDVSRIAYPQNMVAIRRKDGSTAIVAEGELA